MYQITSCDDKERDDNNNELQRNIKVRTKTCNSTEEESHGQVACHDGQVVGEEGARVADQTTHEVDNHTEDEDLRSRKGDIDENLGKPESRRAMEGVSAVLVDNWTSK